MRSYTVTKIYDAAAGIYCEFTPADDGIPSKDLQTLLFDISSFHDARLAEGKTVSDERFEELYEISCTATAVAKAQTFLSGGIHSKKQLVQKLVKSNVERPHAKKAALIMEKRGYINEEEQAERMALAYCRRKYWGKTRIARELLFKGYDKSAVNAAVGNISPEEYKNSLMTVIERKYPNPPDDKKERDRRIAALSRLGYSFSEITEAFRKNYKQ